MTTQTAPAPLTRMNVTKDDYIWKRDSPVSDNRFNVRGFARPCSPPLKHITIQSTQELLEHFDPLDILDSASERSASSADTMIMMTTEEERKNTQRIRNSLRHYESNTSQQQQQQHQQQQQQQQRHLQEQQFSSTSSLSFSSFSSSSSHGNFGKTGDFAKRKSVPNNIGLSCRPTAGDGDKRFPINGDKPSPLDDGYGTDSRSNASVSTSSPLSSSFSSLSTFEGSFNANHNTAGIPATFHSPTSPPIAPSGNMSRNVILKGHPLSAGSRSSGQKPVVLAAKRRDVPVEAKDTGPNLEDRLRALTTIQEEELHLGQSGNARDKAVVGGYPVSNDSKSHPNTGRICIFDSTSSRDQRSSSITPDDTTSSFRNDDRENSNTGFFRAVPVKIVASPEFVPQDATATSKNGDVQLQQGHRSKAPTATPSNSSPQGAGDGWRDYTRYFEKHTDIPLHNIASLGHRKFSNSVSSENCQDKDINKQLGSRSSTHPKRIEGDHHHPAGSDYFSRDSASDNGHPNNNFANSRPPESGVQSHSGHMDYPLNSDLKGANSHSLMSLSDLRSQSSSWMNESVSGHSSLPISTNQDSFDYNMDQRHSSYPQHYSASRQFASQQQQQQQQQQQYKQHPDPQQNGRYLHQTEPSAQVDEYDNLQYNHSPVRRTSRDEMISLSRSLSKQYMQQREMLQQQQQQQQQLHQHHHRHHQQQQQQQQQPRQFQQLPFHPESHIDYHQTNNGVSTYSTNYPEVLLRNSSLSSSTRSLSNRGDRYSWQPSSDPAHQLPYDSDAAGRLGTNNRVSLDLGSIPQLQRQIRATSEMCLQMSKRHAFASSADICKLFQGHKRKPDRQDGATSGTGVDSHGVSSSSNGRSQFHRHSFHTTPYGGSWAGSQPTLNVQNAKDEPLKSLGSSISVKPLLRVPSPASTNSYASNPGPLRVDHSITIPPNAWTNVPPEIPTISVDSNSSLLFQRQSSGYSSENELQQIEFNAKAARKMKVKDQSLNKPLIINPEQEFRPVNPSLDGGSSTGVDDEASSLADNEPVYVNQRMIANTRALNSLAKPPSTQPSISDTHSPLPPRSNSLRSINSTSLHSSSPNLYQHSHHHPHQHIFQQQQQPHQYRPHQQQQHQQQTYSQHQHGAEPAITKQTNINVHSEDQSFTQKQNEKITQNQVINFHNKAVTIKSFVPAHSHSPTFVNDNNAINASLAGTHQLQTSPTHLKVGPPEMPRDAIKIIKDPSGQPPRPLRSGSSSSLQLSPVEIAQMLEVPFATNIISDEKGDRLSTLV